MKTLRASTLVAVALVALASPTAASAESHESIGFATQTKAYYALLNTFSQLAL